jgi:hypothetical protein
MHEADINIILKMGLYVVTYYNWVKAPFLTGATKKPIYFTGKEVKCEG